MSFELLNTFGQLSPKDNTTVVISLFLVQTKTSEDDRENCENINVTEAEI